MADDRVKQVKQANDIVDVVGGYLALRPAGPTYKGLCPFHDDHRPSFDVDPRRQRYRCWSCGKYGDVISFVQEHERVSFLEAIELLARRVGITLEKSAGATASAQSRALMLDVLRWAAQKYHECLLDDDLAADARRYLGERGLTGETVRKYGLGYAPRSWDWLVRKAQDGPGRVPLEVLEAVGLIGARKARADEEEGEVAPKQGFYDRFRDRVLFPIRDVRGQPVAFGGRILPTSPLSSRDAKYYNSCDTPLFSKSEHLYGIDQARNAAAKVGYLAVVEGYTDVLMAHQMGVGQVVATMGTALNARHVRQLRRFAPRVVLVFDADAGGDTGVDRALEIFVGHEVDLRIASLPAGLDPCDLLVEQGPDPFRRAMESAIDALEFKLTSALSAADATGVEGQRRAIESVLSVIAQVPPLPGQAGAVRMQLIVNRIAQRLTLKEETVWARLKELRASRQSREQTREPGRGDPRMGSSGKEGGRGQDSEGSGHGRKPAAPEERQLLEVLLSDPDLVPQAAEAVRPEEIEHPGLRRLLVGLYAQLKRGEPPTLDLLRGHLEDNPRLAQKALEMQEVGSANPNRPAWLRQLLNHFQERRARTVKQELRNQLQAANDANDHQAALELLRRLQNRTSELGPDTSSLGERTGDRGESASASPLA